MGAALRKRLHRCEKRDRDFFEAFPNGTIWSNDQNGKGYDVVLLGQAGETKINLDEMQQRLKESGYRRVARLFREIGFASALDLVAGYSAGRATWRHGCRMQRSIATGIYAWNILRDLP